MRRWVSAAAVVALAGCGTGDDDASDERAEAVFYTIADDCGLPAGAVGDGGASITLTTTSSADVEKVGCVLGATDAPDYVIETIGATSPGEGRQSDEWGEGVFEARWTVKDGTSMDITFIDTSQ